MKSTRPGTRPCAREGGFALLALMAAVGAACMGLLMAVGSFVPDPGERQLRVGHDLEIAQRLVADQFLRTGAFPSSLATVETAGEVIDDSWSYDPFGRGARLQYGMTASGAQVTSCGTDQQLGSADDRSVAIGAEPLLRVRQRLRLRLLRAVHVQDLVAAIDAAGAPSTAVAQTVRSHAIARRQWLTATPAQRAVLQTTMNTAETVLTTLLAVTTYVAPVSVTGAGGFMARLGLGDARAVDGVGRAYELHPVLGVIAVGYDGVGGTDDDM